MLISVMQEDTSSLPQESFDSPENSKSTQLHAVVQETEMPSGKMVAEMTDKEVLQVLQSKQASVEMKMQALRETETRSIPGFIESSVALLQSDSYVIRVETVKALMRTRDPRSVTILIGVLDDHDPAVRGHAAEALGVLGSRKTLEYLSLRLSREEVEAVRIALKRAIEKISGYPINGGR